MTSRQGIVGSIERPVRQVYKGLREKREGLPVHRHLHAKLGSLYAFRSELDAWWRDGQGRIEQSERVGSETLESQPPFQNETVAPGARPREGAGVPGTLRGLSDPATGGVLRPGVRPWSVVAGGGLLIVIAFTTAWTVGHRIGVRSREQTPTQSPPSFLTLTSRRGYIPQARFAPDGETVVYSAAWDGQPLDVYLTRLDSIESRSLGLYGASVLAVSSNGELAISEGCRYDHAGLGCLGTLARVPLAGGAPRTVAEHVRQADWSPDGFQLAAVVEDRLRRTFRLEYPVGRVLYTSPPDGWIGYPRVSPAGDLIAFSRKRLMSRTPSHSGRDGRQLSSVLPPSVVSRWTCGCH